jgi:microcystin-dependent protein
MEGIIGEIRMFGGNFAPKAWALCQGQILPINSNTALFSILGTTYGGNGTSTFGLPNLMGRAAVGEGTGPGLSSYTLGEVGGTSNVTLTNATMPAHNHFVSGSVSATPTAPASSSDATSPEVGDKMFPATTESAELYTGTANDVMGAYQTQVTFPTGLTVGNVGAAIPFSTLDPTLAVYYIICMFGVYPARN